MKQNKILAIAALLALASQAEARTLTPEAALQRARQAAGTPTAIRAMRTPAKVTPALTLTEAQMPVVYVIADQEDNGYMILSADDIAAPVLGYSETGSFDPANMPENMRFWLGEYQREIASAITAGATAYKAPRAASRATVAPMLTTKWNQDAPYNGLAPVINGTKCPTGCVATAMAQVIKWHGYPTKGVGSNSYKLGTETLSFNFANTTFEYSKMLNSYNNSSSTESKDAVATLMYACGIAVNMGFGPAASGAMSGAVPMAMREYFGYDKSAKSVLRFPYTKEQWEEIVYNEMTQNGPVFYAGTGDGGGHAFIADGYRDGYFHFNWGWGGMSDGYFLLGALNPTDQGIGGAGSGESFNDRQSVMVNVSKPKADSQLPLPVVSCSNPITLMDAGSGLNILGTFFNYSPYAVTGRVVIELTNKADGKVRTLRSVEMTMKAGSGILNPTCTSLLSSSWDGEYTGRLGWQPKGETELVPLVLMPIYTGSLDVKIENKAFVKADLVKTSDFSFGVPTFNSPLYTNKMFGASIPYTFNSEMDNMLLNVTPLLMNAKGERVARGVTQTSFLYAGSNTLEYIGGWVEPATAPAGSYKLVFATGANDNYPTLLTEPVDVTLSAGPGGISMIRINNADWSIADADAVDASKLTVNAAPTGLSGYFVGAIEARIYEPGTSNVVGRIQSPTIFVSAGTKDNISWTGVFVDAVPGKTYEMKLYTSTGTTLTSVAKSFTVSAESSLTDIEASGNAAPEYFNLQGVRVENPAPGAGLLLRREGSKVSKVIL